MAINLFPNSSSLRPTRVSKHGRRVYRENSPESADRYTEAAGTQLDNEGAREASDYGADGVEDGHCEDAKDTGKRGTGLGWGERCAGCERPGFGCAEGIVEGISAGGGGEWKDPECGTSGVGGEGTSTGLETGDGERGRVQPWQVRR